MSHSLMLSEEAAEAKALDATWCTCVVRISIESRWVNSLNAPVAMRPIRELAMTSCAMRSADVALDSIAPVTVTLSKLSRCSGDGNVKLFKSVYNK